VLEANYLDQSILDARAHLNFFGMGELVETSNLTDLAISGNGFFTVRDSVQNIFYATRDGAFQLDDSGHLVDSNGYRVQGFTDGSLTVMGDIIIDANGAPGATVSSFDIDWEGMIDVVLSDGTELVRGQILLQEYQDLQALAPAGNLLYANVAAAAPLFSQGTPGTYGLGILFSGTLEVPYAAPFLQLEPQTGFRLYVSSLESEATVQASSDLKNWIDVGQVAGGVMDDAEFFDTNAPAPKARFYRLRLN
jgi:hypothetical protein